jgi:CDP-diacylglycerol--serine O-phosphatidyltransferase
MKINLAWVPNSLTLGNLLLGFISIVISGQGPVMYAQPFFIAGILILGAALLDGLDGQVARFLKVESSLGAELDSLADCVAFGVAPGYLAYKAYLAGIIYIELLGLQFDMGILIASLFPICAAYRLARFNVSHDSSSFSGLPSPMAGMILAIVPIFFRDVQTLNQGTGRIIFTVLFVLVALLMVSTFRYSKPNQSIVKNITSIRLIIFIIVIVLLVIFFKEMTIFILFGLYILSGILSFVIQFIQDHKY